MPSYNSPKIELRKSGIEGKGVFAKKRIKKGELITDFTGGLGKILNKEEANRLYTADDPFFDYMIQIDNDLYFGATREEEMEIGDYLNHSCDPNCGIRNALQIIAIRDIEKDEEVTFDYAMSESSNFKIPCGCEAIHCRGFISGEDWKRKDLQEKYRGYFSGYLAKKITEDYS